MTDFSDRLTEAIDKLTKRAEKEGGVAYSLISSKEEAAESGLSNNFMPFDHVWSQKFYGGSGHDQKGPPVEQCVVAHGAAPGVWGPSAR